MKYPLFSFFLALASGIFFADLNPGLEGSTAAAILVSCLGLAFLFRRQTLIYLVFVAAASVAMGAFVYSVSVQSVQRTQWERVLSATAEAPVRLSGVIARNRRETFRFGKPGLVFEMNRLELLEPFKRKLPGSVRVFIPGKHGDWAYGKGLILEGALRPLKPLRNPYGFNESRWGLMKGIHAYLKVKEAAGRGPVPGRLESSVYAFKNRLLERLDQVMEDTRLADMAKAMLLGERGEVDEELERSFRITGTQHLFAISGLNVVMVACVVFFLLGLLRLDYVTQRVSAIVIICLYCALTGASAPAERATLMASVFFIAQILNRRSHALNALGLSGSALLLLNPYQVFDVGFILSFAAVWGLVVISPRLSWVSSASSEFKASWTGRLTRFADDLYTTSLGAWLVTAPWIAHNFHRVNMISPLVNAMLVPWVFVLMSALTLLMVLSVLPLWAGGWMGLWVRFFSGIIVTIVQFFERGSFAAREFPSMTVTGWVLLGLAAWFFVMFAFRLKPLWRSVFAVTALLAVLGINAALVKGERGRETAVTFFDVGQGDSALFEWNGKTLLVDTGRGGEWDMAERVIVPYLEARGITRLDYLVLTHSDYDHAGGAFYLISKMKVGQVIENGLEAPEPYYRSIRKLIRERGIGFRGVHAGMDLKWGDGMKIRVLNPPEPPLMAEDQNDNSLVFWIELEGKTFLMTGDMAEEGCRETLARLGTQTVDVLKVPHHGARLGECSESLVRKLKPRVSVVSAGENNLYGHPRAETLSVLEKYSGFVHRTDKQGAARFVIRHDGALTRDVQLR